MKKIEVTHTNFYNVGPGITTIREYEGQEFPSDWKWLRKLLTSWKLISKSLERGKPTKESLVRRYGKNTLIKMYY